MKKEPRDIGIETVEVADLHRFPDAILEMLEGRRRGLLIRGAFPPELCERLVVGLENSAGRRGKLEPFYVPVPEQSYPEGEAILGSSDPLIYGSLIFGTPLILATKDPTGEHYLERAREFRQLVGDVWTDSPGFEERFVSILRQMAGGREVAPPVSASGKPFAPLHIKGIENRGALAIHCGNETHDGDLLALLEKHIDVGVGQISYLVLLRHPESGGELRVYGLEWTMPEGLRVRNASRTAPEIIELCESAGYADLDPQAGDVILFDGGRYYHRVNAVRGEISRWTGQGFLALSHDHQTVRYWF